MLCDWWKMLLRVIGKVLSLRESGGLDQKGYKKVTGLRCIILTLILYGDELEEEVGRDSERPTKGIE